MTDNAATAPFRGVIAIGMLGSGTSTLTTLLRKHSGVLDTAVGVFTSDWYRAADPVRALVEDSTAEICSDAGFVSALRERVTGPMSLAEAARTVFGVLAEWRGTDARTWAETTSRHFGHLPVLMDDFGGDTRTVAVVRDPREMLAATAEASNRTPTARDAEAFCKRWITADRLLGHYARRFASDFLVVRHEDLCGDTEYAMRRVCKHVGLRWNGALSASDIAECKPHAPLPDESTQLIEELLGHRMERWGYGRTTRDRLGIRRVAFEAMSLGRELRARRSWTEGTKAGFDSAD